MKAFLILLSILILTVEPSWAVPTGTTVRYVITDTNGVLTGTSTNFADINGLVRIGEFTAVDVGAVPIDDPTYTDTVAKAAGALQSDPFFELDPDYGILPYTGVRFKSEFLHLKIASVSVDQLDGVLYTTNYAMLSPTAFLIFSSGIENKFRFSPNGQSFPLMEYEDINGWHSTRIPSNAIDDATDDAYRNDATKFDFSLCPTSDVGLATGRVWVSDGFLKVVQ